MTRRIKFCFVLFFFVFKKYSNEFFLKNKQNSSPKEFVALGTVSRGGGFLLADDDDDDEATRTLTRRLKNERIFSPQKKR